MALLWLDAQLNRSQVEFGRNASLHVRRAKQGRPSVHPIRGEELRLLTALRKEYPDSVYVFTSERGTPFTPDATSRSNSAISIRSACRACAFRRGIRRSRFRRIAAPTGSYRPCWTGLLAARWPTASGRAGICRRSRGPSAPAR